MADDEKGMRTLFHPVYLDTPMMVSFLASLQGGVSFEDEATRRSSTSDTKEREGGAKVKIPGLGSLLGFDASGRMGSKRTGDDSEEVTAVRQYTAASLFNALQSVLRDEGIVRQITTEGDLTAVAAGDVVEIEGEFVGNPLEEVLDFFGRALPYFEITQRDEVQEAESEFEALAEDARKLFDDAEALDAKAKHGSKSKNPARQAEATDLARQAKETGEQAQAKQAEAVAAYTPVAEQATQEVGIRILGQAVEDLASTSVHDTVIEGQGFKAVLTLSSEFFTDPTRAQLRDGYFRAVGKVTRVLTEGDEINLMRRTVMGAMGAEGGRDLINGMVEEGELDFKTFDPIIEAPAIQVLPLAIYT